MITTQPINITRGDITLVIAILDAGLGIVNFCVDFWRPRNDFLGWIQKCYRSTMIF